MQFAFSLATGIVWSLVALLELTSFFPEPFWLSPIRTGLIAAVGISGLVISTLHYSWHLWYARAVAALTLIFLGLSYFFPLLPDNQLRIPTIIGFVLWAVYASVAGYERPTSSNAIASSRR
jgi:hypothetical protein